MINILKNLLVPYKSDREHWIGLDKIHISPTFASSRVGSKKLSLKWKHYLSTGEFESRILLDKNFTLVDGYSTYLIANKMNLGKVAVQFKN